MGDRIHHWPRQYTFSTQNATYNDFWGGHSGVNLVQKDDQIQPQTALGLGSSFRLDKEKLTSNIAERVDSFKQASKSVVPQGDLPPCFQFDTQAKRGRPKGSKTRKMGEKSGQVGMGKADFKDCSSSRKRGHSLLSVDPVEPSASLGTEKRSKGQPVEIEANLDVKVLGSIEVVASLSLHCQVERGPYAGTVEGLGTLRQFVPYHPLPLITALLWCLFVNLNIVLWSLTIVSIFCGCRIIL